MTSGTPRAATSFGTFDTKEEALSVIQQALAKHGAEYVETLLLGQQDSHGQTKAIARGKKLVQIARAASPARSA